jgi:arsenate reductase
MKNLFPNIQQHLQSLETGFDSIPESRKTRLLEVADFIKDQRAAGRQAPLLFICTHNSRRSHFGQVWAKVMAEGYGVTGVETYSGGTEATAFNTNAIQALRKIGLEVEAQGAGRNPVYAVKYSETRKPLLAWSKVYSDAANPQEGFCAIMTCSEADEACPIVAGAARRVALPYEDPKQADGSPQEAATYLLRSKQIATEMAYVMHMSNPSTP